MKENKTRFLKGGLGQLTIPVIAVALLVIFNLIRDPGFFSISITHNNYGNAVLAGNLISIINGASELAVLKGALADRGQCAREDERGESRVVERRDADACHTVTHGNVAQVVAVVEDALLDCRDAGGNVDACQRGAAGKRAIADGGHVVILKGDSRKSRAALERGALDGRGVAADDQRLEP